MGGEATWYRSKGQVSGLGYEVNSSHIKGSRNQIVAFESGIIKVAPANKKGCNKRDEGLDNHHEGGRDQACRRNQVWEHRNDDWQEQREYQHSVVQKNSRERSRSCNRSWAQTNQRHRPVRVYLSQLPRDMEEDELQEIAAEYGKVLQYELHREGAYKCGWVEYASKREAEAAVNELDDRRMNEWNMRLQAYMYPGGGV